jgi:hypothetical protein
MSIECCELRKSVNTNELLDISHENLEGNRLSFQSALNTERYNVDINAYHGPHSAIKSSILTLCPNDFRVSNSLWNGAARFPHNNCAITI